MNNFSTHKLSEIYTISSGISTTKEQAGHGAPFVSYSDVYNNYFLPAKLTEKMNTSTEEQAIYSVRAGDVFLTRTSETLDELALSSVALVDYPEATFSGFTKRLRPKGQGVVDPTFMGFFFRSSYFRKIITNVTTMTTRASFNETLFSHISVELPDYETQRRIGRFLYLMEEQIAINKEVNLRLQELLHRSFEYWFIQFDFPDDIGRPYRSSGGKMVWNSELEREIPDGWRVLSIGELLQRSRREYNYGTISPAIDLSVMDSGSLSIDRRSASTDFSSNLFELQRGDILFGSIRPYLAKAGIAPFDGAVAGTILTFQARDTRYYNFILAVLTHRSIFKYATAASTGTKMPVISADSLLRYKVPFQPEVAAKFQELSVKDPIIDNVQQNYSLRTVQQWILPMLISGQVQISA
jgi:type I restriction enzyme S subunit